MRGIGSSQRPAALLLVGSLLVACASPLPEWEDSLENGEAVTGDAEPAVECESVALEFAEGMHLISVPEGLSVMVVKAWGAGGNGEHLCASAAVSGGTGGFSEAVLNVEPGEPLQVVVGSAGMSGEKDRGDVGFAAPGGGGLSGVFWGAEPVAEDDLSRAIAIAGGGGGAGWHECRPGKTGNHPSSGGEARMRGAPGEAQKINGGGGGFSGGSGGALAMPGSGGRGFVTEEALSKTIVYVEPGFGIAPHSEDPDYAEPAGTTERAGRVVLHFRRPCE